MNYTIPLTSRNLSGLIRLSIAAIIVCLLAGCQNRLAIRATDDQVLEAGHEIAPGPVIIAEDPTHRIYAGVKNSQLIHTVYKHLGFEPIWFHEGRLSVEGGRVAGLISSARRYGLLPQHYQAQEIMELTHGSDIASRARLDVLLTNGFISFVDDLTGARTSRHVGDTLRAIAMVDSARAVGVMNVVKRFEPTIEGYVNLKQALNQMLDTIPDADRMLLMQGHTYDSSTVQQMVRTIEINMERWRKEKEPWTSPHVLVNIPAYMFYVKEDGSTVLSSKVVVGAPATPTPEFSSNIECYTIFPYWYVPRKITVKEYLPLIKKDTSFVTRNKFDVLDKKGKIVPLSTIDWKQYNANNFPFTLRQREGEENSLGVLKFVFDNPYAVYVHDTNSKRLFLHKNRAYSHGCIRLEKAREFAHYLLKDGRSGTPSATVDKYLAEQKRTTISLLKAVPIHIRYFTADVQNGKLQVYNDVYKKDKAMIQRLYQAEVF